MKRNITILILVVAAFFVTGSVSNTHAQAPSAVVADLYKQHDANRSPFFQTKSRARVDKYFTKPLADLIWKDVTTRGDGVGALDGDPLYNAQDIKIKRFAVGKAAVRGESSTVPVTFTNFRKKENIKFSLKKVKGVWKIDDIAYGGGETLRKWLTSE